MTSFPGFETQSELVAALSLDGRIERAVELLRLHEPAEGYYVAFSGGKDSVAALHLVKLAGVKHEVFYNNTTIDPPELVRFIKKQHPAVIWNHPKQPMMTMVATAPKVPPTRSGRWCCSVYKEGGGHGRVKVMGVRAAESPGRARNWREAAEDMHGNPTICPIVYWTDEHVWEFIKALKVPYCELYDEGWIANWEKWHDVPRMKDGGARYHAKFRSGEDFYQWWLTAQAPDYMREDCMSGLLWTNGPALEQDPDGLKPELRTGTPEPAKAGTTILKP